MWKEGYLNDNQYVVTPWVTWDAVTAPHLHACRNAIGRGAHTWISPFLFYSFSSLVGPTHNLYFPFVEVPKSWNFKVSSSCCFFLNLQSLKFWKLGKDLLKKYKNWANIFLSRYYNFWKCHFPFPLEYSWHIIKRLNSKCQSCQNKISGLNLIAWGHGRNYPPISCTHYVLKCMSKTNISKISKLILGKLNIGKMVFIKCIISS